MPRFNPPRPSGPPARNHHNTPAYTRSAHSEFLSLLLSTFLKPTFYQSAANQATRLFELASQVGPDFAAKAAIFARRYFGMRSATHLVGAALASHRFITKRAFYKALVERPDDITETLALYAQLNPRPGKRATFPNAMKRGFADALSTFSAYQLAKYRGGSRALSLQDAVNLCHPKSTPQLAALMTNTLEPADTWEVALTQAGSDPAAKTAAWTSLLEREALGHMALLRNLRNISQHAPSMLPLALSQLEAGVGKTLLFPYRYLVAGDQFSPTDPSATPIHQSLARCLDQAVLKLEPLPGRTAIAVDVSGSMRWGAPSDSPARKACLFGSALALTNPNSILLTFATTATAHQVIPGTPASVLTSLLLNQAGGSTNFRSIFRALGSTPVDRIIILSDGEANSAPQAAQTYLNNYRAASGASPKLFFFDLTGQSTAQFPDSSIYLMSGLSDKALDLIRYLDQDRSLLINLISSISLTA